MKIITKILFAIIVVFVPVAVRVAHADPISCDLGWFLPAGVAECKECPEGCKSGQFLPSGKNVCATCVEGAPCPGPIGFYCLGFDNLESNDSEPVGLSKCNSQYPESDLGSRTEGHCYVTIKFNIGKNAQFHNQTADNGGYVFEKLHYSVNTYASPTKVFTGDTSGGAYLNSIYLLGGDGVPTRPGYKFKGWLLTHKEGDPTSVAGNTYISPEWDMETRTLYTSLIAEWGCGTNTVPGTGVNAGKCLCRQGYYGDVENGEECQRCPCGKTTKQSGATTDDKCEYVFGNGGSATGWGWPSNLKSTSFNYNNVTGITNCP